MKSVAVAQLESLLETKKLDHTLRRSWVETLEDQTLSSGIASLDAVLVGGWRRGEVSELVGPRSSGRTRVLLSTLAGATSGGGLVAVVDALDQFDPQSAVAMGVDLSRVLWVRGPSLAGASARAPILERAVRQAVRACDLIIRAGGFAVVALDLADVPVRQLRALPFTTWLRLAHANEGQDTVCLLAGHVPLGRSPRGVSLRLSATAAWTGTSAQSRRLAGLDIQAHVVNTARATKIRCRQRHPASRTA